MTTSNELTHLYKTIDEKELFIGNLQTQHEKDRFELQRQYELKEIECRNLRKEYKELSQRLEHLQNQNQTTIPDNHRLLNPDEFQIYEQTKQKIHQLEKINKNLLDEKQAFLEELKLYQETKKQLQLLQLQINHLKNQGRIIFILFCSLFTSFLLVEQIKIQQFAEKETSYQQQIQDYQSQINEKERNV